MAKLNLSNLIKHKEDILKAEMGTLMFNLGKTHVGFWQRRGEIVYFHPLDEADFKKEYGYKPFRSYKSYFNGDKTKNSPTHAVTPFEKDLNLKDLSKEQRKALKDFFHGTKIDFNFNGKNESLKLIDIPIDFMARKSFINKVMFAGCENVNSGIDKGAPKEQLQYLQIANAFGTVKETIIDRNKNCKGRSRYDKRRMEFFQDIAKELCKADCDGLDYLTMRRVLLDKIKGWYTHLLSDTRFPINDVTLWDQVYMTASLFKAALAALCLEGKRYDDYIKKPREIRWSIMGVQYDKLGLAEKALSPVFIDWYRDKAHEADKEIKHVIEEEYALGNEVYRDETGIYFIVPENICGEEMDTEAGLYRLDEKLIQIQEEIIACFKIFDGEVFPSILLTKPSRGTMNIAHLLDKAKENFLKPVFPKNNYLDEYFQEMEDIEGFKVICDVCRVRLAAKDDEALNLCNICREREKIREGGGLRHKDKETIWTGELQDKNDRIALVTVKFELGEWLNGNMINTTVISEGNMAETLEKLKDELGDKDGRPTKSSALKNILYEGDLKGPNLKGYTNFILLERAIGDRWEKLLERELNKNIDFKARKLKHVPENNDFIARMLLQFVTRKNPSPARFRRIWETTEEFFKCIDEQLPALLSIPPWRSRRIKWEQIIKDDWLKGQEFTYRGLEFISDQQGSLYLISSIEKAIPILCNKATKEVRDKDYIKHVQRLVEEGREDEKWFKEEIEVTAVSGSERYPIKLGNAKYIPYKPYLSIIKPTPVSWQFIIPAEYVPNLIETIQSKYDEEFKYVKGKLPLHIGVIFQNYKKPLYIGVKALRKIRRDLQDWEAIEKEVYGDKLKDMVDGAVAVAEAKGSTMDENSEMLKKYYSLYPLSHGNKGDFNFYINPKKSPMGIKSVANAKPDETYIIYPNTIDFEFLDVNTRRNEIYYDEDRGKRKIYSKGNRPYEEAQWSGFINFRNYFKTEGRSAKLQNIVSLIYSKLSDWQGEEDIKIFMLSAFVNVFELKNETSRDEFSKIFGLDTWDGLINRNEGLFKKELYKFLDAYDFWHNCLREI